MPPKRSDDPKTERHNFNMTPKLKARLIEAREKNGNSMNAEIHARLEATFDEPAAEFAATIWPILQKLNEAERATFTALVAAMTGKAKK